MSIETELQRGLYTKDSEKTNVDKLLARKDIDEIKVLISKERLTRSELLQLLYLMSSSEVKLYNYSTWDRYLQLKIFIWLRDFVKVVEKLYDYEEDLEKNPKTIISIRTKQMILNIRRSMESNIKFLADVHLNIGRSSLSVGATGFMELLKTRYESHVYDSRDTKPDKPRGLFGGGKNND